MPVFFLTLLFGAFFFSVGCCCGCKAPPDDTGWSADGAAADTATSLALTLFGVVNQDCSDCGDMNATYVLPFFDIAALSADYINETPFPSGKCWSDALGISLFLDYFGSQSGLSGCRTEVVLQVGIFITTDVGTTVGSVGGPLKHTDVSALPVTPLVSSGGQTQCNTAAAAITLTCV